MKYFSESVTRIEILPSSRFTVFCLETKIYVYTRNGRDLHDIIDCHKPVISSVIYKPLQQKIVLAFIDKVHTEMVRVMNQSSPME